MDNPVDTQFTATGYILSGIEVNPEREVGTALLLIDSTMQQPLAMEISRYISDLQDEGWKVVTQICSSDRAVRWQRSEKQ